MGTAPERWLLPLAIVWADDVRPLSQDLAVAYVSFEGSAGLLTDAFSLPVFARSLLEGCRRLRALPRAKARLSSRAKVGQSANGGRQVRDLAVRRAVQ